MKKYLLASFLILQYAAAAQSIYKDTLIEKDAGIRSDQRPVTVGLYDVNAEKTFITWMGAESNTFIKSYDHKRGTWSAAKLIGRSTFRDKHNYPSMIRGKNGQLYVFYGAHNSTLRMAISPKPSSIEGTWQDGFIDIAERASYPAPVITSQGTMYVFYRDTRKTNKHDDDRPYAYVRSNDGGKTWTRSLAIDPYPRQEDNMCEVYNGKVTYQPASKKVSARIHLAWTIAGEKAGKHAHATYGRNVYYAWLNPANDHLYNIKGVDLGTTIDNQESDKYCLVLDTGIPGKGHLAGLQVSVHYLDNGLPLIYFDNQLNGGPGTAQWSGRKWNFTKLDTANTDDRELRDPRDMEKTGPSSFKIYKPAGNTIKVYETTNGGSSWQLSATIPMKVEVDRVHVIVNARPEVKLLVTEAGDRDIEVPKRDLFVVSEFKK